MLVDGSEDDADAALREPLPSLPHRIKWARSFGSIPGGEIDITTPPRAARASSSADIDPESAHDASCPLGTQDLDAAMADADLGDQIGLGGGMSGDTD